jgi:hypothetical protein
MFLMALILYIRRSSIQEQSGSGYWQKKQLSNILSCVYRQRAFLSLLFSSSSSFVCIFKYFGSEIADIESRASPHNCRCPVGSSSNHWFLFRGSSREDISFSERWDYRFFHSLLSSSIRSGGSTKCALLVQFVCLSRLTGHFTHICIQGPHLCSSCQSSWLEIQRSGFDSHRYQIFWEAVGLERGPLILVSTTDRLCGLVVRVPGYRSRNPGSISGATRYSEK